jgi:hypothetical protein
MSILPITAIDLASKGAHIVVGAEAQYLPASVLDLIRMATLHGGNVTVHAKNYMPATLQQMVLAGNGNVTIVI